jgi:hypothetical protein
MIIRVLTSLLHESPPSELGGDTNLPIKKIIRNTQSQFYFYLTKKEYQKQIIMFLGSRARPVLKADNLTTICEPIV